MTTKPLIRAVYSGVLERLDGVPIRGAKTRADAALNYVCGAAAMAQALGNHDALGVMTGCAFLISIRGESEIKQWLADNPAEG